MLSINVSSTSMLAATKRADEDPHTASGVASQSPPSSPAGDAPESPSSGPSTPPTLRIQVSRSPSPSALSLRGPVSSDHALIWGSPWAQPATDEVFHNDDRVDVTQAPLQLSPSAQCQGRMLSFGACAAGREEDDLECASTEQEPTTMPPPPVANRAVPRRSRIRWPSRRGASAGLPETAPPQAIPTPRGMGDRKVDAPGVAPPVAAASAGRRRGGLRWPARRASTAGLENTLTGV